MNEPVGAAPFHALIVPHRSLSPRAMTRLLVAIGVLCCINATVFVSIGAWPVGGFTGAELLIAAVLFNVHARSARGSELLLLSDGAMRIVRTAPSGLRRERVLPVGWLRVVLRERPGRVAALLLVARGEEEEEVGSVLGDEPKRDLARALEAALRRWRSPDFDNPQLREPVPAEPHLAAQRPPCVPGTLSTPGDCPI